MDVYNASLISDIAKECALSQLQWKHLHAARREDL